MNVTEELKAEAAAILAEKNQPAQEQEAQQEQPEQEQETQIEQPEAQAQEAEKEEKEYNEDEFASQITGIKKKDKEEKAEEKPKAVEKQEEADPFIEHLKNLKAQGKDLKEELLKIASTDPSKLTPEQLFEQEVQQLIAEGLSPEEADEQRDDFKEKSNAEKLRLTRPIREKMKAEHERQLELLKPDTSFQKAHEERLDRAAAEAETVFKDIEGAEYMGLELTPERVKQVKEYVESGGRYAFYKENGDFDMQEMVEYAIWKNHRAEIIKAIAGKARQTGKKEVLDSRNRPSLETRREAVAPKNLSPIEKAEAYLDKKLAERNQN